MHARRTDWDKISRATEISKNNILKNYYCVGVLEQFDATLKLFEKMLPSVFQGATEEYHGECEFKSYFENLTARKFISKAIKKIVYEFRRSKLRPGNENETSRSLQKWDNSKNGKNSTIRYGYLQPHKSHI